MTKILASIKNVHEAEIISKFNFDIVDIKNVQDGALGYVGDSSIAVSTRYAISFLSLSPIVSVTVAGRFYS